MVNRFYLVSSLFFLSGAIVARCESASAVNDLYIGGALFFFIAATLNVVGKKK